MEVGDWRRKGWRGGGGGWTKFEKEVVGNIEGLYKVGGLGPLCQLGSIKLMK